MTADEVVRALAAKHAKDVFVPECNLGSAWGSCRRIDAWAMPKSWSPLTMIGYEVKVARGDFLRDEKWTAYLPVCHALYFACPPGLIQPNELPEAVGLMWAHGSRLITKRKAVRREPDPAKLVALMSYVLMSRSQIVADMHAANGGLGNREWWRRWLEEKREDQALGYRCSKAVRERLREAERAKRAAEEDRARLEYVEAALIKLGFDPRAGVWNVERKLSERPALAEVRRLAQSILRATEGSTC